MPGKPVNLNKITKELIKGNGYRYAVARNVKATDSHGKETRIAIAFIEHENGFRQRHAIPEEFIRYAGDHVIDLEVEEAARNPKR